MKANPLSDYHYSPSLQGFTQNVPPWRLTGRANSPMAYDPNKPIDLTTGMLGSWAQFCFLLHNVRSYILCWTTLTLTQTKDQTRSFVF